MDEDNGEVVEEPLEENITGQSESGNTDDHTPTDTEPKVGIAKDPLIYFLTKSYYHLGWRTTHSKRDRISTSIIKSSNTATTVNWPR